jgi:hypothetical protein
MFLERRDTSIALGDLALDTGAFMHPTGVTKRGWAYLDQTDPLPSGGWLRNRWTCPVEIHHGVDRSDFVSHD